ncbi:fimbrial protein [Vibrio splendidus]|uniref:fimbrial protein n=1 Tax=Vibrio splendidus TaxID=29497 RepID=UPI002235F889|nr:fimbrial protein [Vibrio splendidus]MCW4438856.1 fimbrial protein [Vibrio splendidus]
MSLLRNITSSLLVMLFVFFCSESFAALKDGDCYGYPQQTLSNVATRVYNNSGFESIVNDSTDYGSVTDPYPGYALRINTDTAFCICESPNDSKDRVSVFMSRYYGSPTFSPPLSYNGNTVNLLELNDINGNELPFYVGAMMQTPGSIEVVPYTGYTTSPSSCRQNVSHDGYYGEIKSNAVSNRILQMLFASKGTTVPAGQYQFSVPPVYGYRKFIPISEIDDTVPDVPETIMQFIQVTIYVHNRCVFTDNSVVEVSLGEVSSSNLKGLGDIVDYKTSYQIDFQCNGDTNLKADYYFLDGRDQGGTTSEVLTTDKIGVGVVMENQNGTILSTQTRYNNAITLQQGVGSFEFSAYPVKTDENFELGIYRASATMVIETY